MKTVRFPTGELVPALGLGTWRMGDDRSNRKEEIATIRLALDLGVTLIDTAEMYGDGLSEDLIGEALNGRREEVFLVSKVLPQNASRKGVVAACQRSLKRLQTDTIDLYLLHWPGSHPLSETVAGFVELKQTGKIRHFGVSNFDLKEMQELWNTREGTGLATNQILYNLSRRNVEWDLLPWMREHKIPIMAYSPLEQGRLLNNKRLSSFACGIKTTPAQTALAWLLASDDVIVIPKTSSREHLKENLKAMEYQLTPSQLAELDQIFPPPASSRPLEML